jgi:hypothetical protein
VALHPRGLFPFLAMTGDKVTLCLCDHDGLNDMGYQGQSPVMGPNGSETLSERNPKWVAF